MTSKAQTQSNQEKKATAALVTLNVIQSLTQLKIMERESS